MTTKWFAVLAVNLFVGFGTRAQTEVAGDVRAEVAVAVSTSAEKPARPEKPERPERPKKEVGGQEVKDLVAEFRTKMTEFQSEQKELVKKLRTASEEERTQIREQLKTNREEFHAAKEEFRDSVKDATENLRDHVVKISAEAKAENKGRKIRD